MKYIDILIYVIESSPKPVPFEADLKLNDDELHKIIDVDVESNYTSHEEGQIKIRNNPHRLPRHLIKKDRKKFNKKSNNKIRQKVIPQQIKKPRKFNKIGRNFSCNDQIRNNKDCLNEYKIIDIDSFRDNLQPRQMRCRSSPFIPSSSKFLGLNQNCDINGFCSRSKPMEYTENNHNNNNNNDNNGCMESIQESEYYVNNKSRIEVNNKKIQSRSDVISDIDLKILKDLIDVTDNNIDSNYSNNDMDYSWNSGAFIHDNDNSKNNESFAVKYEESF